MHSRNISIIGIILLMLSVYSVLNIKQAVMDYKIQYAELEHQLEQEKDTIYMFKAELAYLHSPGRLKKLADKYLKLELVRPVQIVANPLVDDKALTTKAKFAENKLPTRWRYKKSASRYISTVADVRQD